MRECIGDQRSRQILKTAEATAYINQLQRQARTTITVACGSNSSIEARCTTAVDISIVNMRPTHTLLHHDLVKYNYDCVLPSQALTRQRNAL